MRRSLLQTLISGLAGWPGQLIKLSFLALINAVVGYGVLVTIERRSWFLAAFLIGALLLLDYAFLGRRNVPIKYFAPGAVFLVAFSLLPTFYTIGVAFTNRATGHEIQKREAIQTISKNAIKQKPNTPTYVQQFACPQGRPSCSTWGSGLIMLLFNNQDGSVAYGNIKGLKTPLLADISLNTASLEAPITAFKGYKILKANEVSAQLLDASLLKVPTGKNSYIVGNGSSATEQQPTLRYDTATDTFYSLIDDSVYKDNGDGNFRAIKGPHLDPADSQHLLIPGWLTNSGFANFERIVKDPDVRKPFIRVFIWTVVFALSTVLTTFVLGLALALVLNKQKMRGVKMYRSFLIIPYAAPGLLTLLVWQGMLNQNNGIVNHLFKQAHITDFLHWLGQLLHLNILSGDAIPWTGNAGWAKASIIFVNLWLGFPYMFLIATGALQSIPQELSEAAEVDGASPWQILRRVKMPLLLLALGPLLVASFAYNFNNFNIIQLLTGGGPPMKDVNTVAGSTDILISYTYRLAFSSGSGNQYALSSAVSIIIFFIVAAMSGPTFWRSKAMEQMT